MDLNSSVNDILSAPTSSYAAFANQNPSSFSYVAGTPSLPSFTNVVGTPVIAPAASSSFWGNIVGGVQTAAGLASTAAAIKTAFAAPKTQVITTTSPGNGASPISVSVSQPQAAPSSNSGLTGIAAQGSQGVDTSSWMMWGAIAAGILALVFLMKRK